MTSRFGIAPGLAIALLALARPSPMNEHASIDSRRFDASGPEVRHFVKETTIRAPARDVFRAWSDGEAFRRTYDASNESLKANIDLAIGGRYEWLWDGELGSNGCQVLSYIPERMISFSWNAPPSQPESRALSTWVVVEFDARGDTETHVRLTHLGFGEAAHWDETYEYFSKAWPHVLEQFRKGLEGE